MNFQQRLFLVSAMAVVLWTGCEGPLTPGSGVPRQLKATSGDAQVLVTWEAVNGATGYHLYWATSAGVTPATGTKIANVTSPYTHANLSNGTSYYYVVTAVLAGGESLPSSISSATPQASTPGQGSVVFSFAPPARNVAPDYYFYPDGFQPGLSKLILSLRKADGSSVLERTALDLVSTATGYQSLPMDLPSGAYQLVEAFAVNALQVTKFIVPQLNSVQAKIGPEFDQDWPGALPISILVADSQTTVPLATRPTASFSKPADYGYQSLSTPLPEPSISPFYAAVDPQGNPVPSFFLQHSHTKTSGGGGLSSAGWGIRSSALKRQLPLSTGLISLEYFRFQIGAFGYRDSEHFLHDPQDIYEHRLIDPTYTVVLQPEATLVELKQAGTNASGQPLIKARITSSQFVEEAFQNAGATESDKYQFFLGFEIGTDAQGDLTPPTTSPVSPLFYTAPYDSQLVQARNDYQTLEAVLVLKNAAALDQLLDSNNTPIMQVYLEVAALKGDGKTVFDPDDEILVSKQQVLNIGSHQISWAP